MNDMTSVPPIVPPGPPTIPVAPALAPLGQNPEEHERISNPVAAIEAILRQPRRVLYQLKQPGSGQLMAAMLLGAVLCGLAYGLVVGTFSMGTQLWAAPAKIAGGLVVSAVICLPSLYIFACLGGSRARLAEICGLVAGLLLLMCLLLVGFAPVAWLFSQSTQSLTWMGGLHLAFWLVSTVFGLRFLQNGFAHTQARSHAGLNTWLVVFVLVAVQMTTALRPILGKADTFLPAGKKFFVAHWADCLKLATPSERTDAKPSSD